MTSKSSYTKAQLELIIKLISCPGGQEPELLKANIALVNADLVKRMHQIASELPKQAGTKDAEWLINLARHLEGFIKLNGEEDKTASKYLSDLTNQYNFFIQILQAIVNSGSDLQHIYPLLKSNLDLVDATWIDLLRDWTRHIVKKIELEETEIIADILYNIGNLFLEFSQGSLLLNLDIAVASYGLALDIYRQLGLQQNLFQTLTNLGSAYNSQAEIGIQTTTNLHQAIDCYTEASQILRELGLEQSLSLTLTNLGIAYCTQAELGIKPAINLQRAVETYLEAVQICRKLELEVQLSATIHNLSNAYLTQSELGIKPAANIKKAIDASTEAAQICRQQRQEKGLSDILINLGKAYYVQAKLGIEPAINLQRAIDIYTEAAQKRQKGDLSPILNRLGNTYLAQAWLGNNTIANLEMAIETYLEASKILFQLDLKRDLSQTLNNLGIAYRTQADLGIEPSANLQQAIRAYREAAQLFRQLELQRDLSATLTNLGVAYRTQADLGIEPSANLQQAIRAYREAAELFQQLGLERELSQALNNLGVTYFTQAQLGIDAVSNLQQAIDTYVKAIQIRRQPEWERELSQTLNNLGTAYLTQAQLQVEPVANLQRASDTYTEAAQILQPGLELELSTILDNLGTTYRTQAQLQIDPVVNLQRAIETYIKAAQIRRQPGLERGLSQTLNNLATAHRTQVELGIESDINRQAAIVSYRDALQSFNPQLLPMDCLRTGRNLGNFAVSQQWWDIALEGYTPAIEAVEQTRFWSITESRKKEVTEAAIQVYRNIIKTYIELKQYDKALEYVDRSKTRNLVELLATRDLTPKGDIPAEILEELQTLRQQLLIAERRLNPDPEQLSTLRQELDNYIQRHIQSLDPSFSLTQKVEPIDFAIMQKTLLDDRTALVAWYVMNDRVLTFIVTRQMSQPYLLELTKESYQAALELGNQYLSRYTQDKIAWKAQLSNFLQQLATLLNLPQLLRHIPNSCDRLILIPHRFLHLFPLHAMPLSNGDLLMERFPRGLSYAPSLQLLQLSQTWSRPSFERFFCVENPTEDLSFTDLEVATIRTYFHPNDDVLQRLEARKTELAPERLNRVNVAHFSCHGYFNFESPSQSALLLAGSKTAATTVSADKTRFWESRDGDAIDLEKCLTLGDIFALDLRQCRLTSLSACETGLTDFKSLGDEYIGLPSGFLYAGSPSVVSSLWTVEELSTAFLMIQFYKNLLNSDRRAEVAIALNGAQLWLRDLTKEQLLKWIDENQILLDPTLEDYLDDRLSELSDSDRPFESPVYWAAFCAIGQ